MDPAQMIRRGDVLWRRTIDAVLVRPVDGDEVVKLAGTGARLWAALDAPRTFGDLCDALAESYDAQADTIAADLRPVIEDLVSRRVIVSRPVIAEAEIGDVRGE